MAVVPWQTKVRRGSEGASGHIGFRSSELRAEYAKIWPNIREKSAPTRLEGVEGEGGQTPIFSVQYPTQKSIPRDN
jgi:hypothetical protein